MRGGNMTAARNPIYQIVTEKEEEFRRQMVGYIKTHFADILGDDVKILDLPNGLDILSERLGLRVSSASKAA